MSKLFLDTSYLLGIHDSHDQWRREALAIQSRLNEAKSLRFSRDLFVSDLVLVETIQELLKRCGYEAANDARRWMLNNLTLLRTSPADISAAFEQICSRYGRGKQRRFGIVDATSVVHMRRQRIGLIVSSDGGFDPVVGVTRVWQNRLDPLELL